MVINRILAIFEHAFIKGGGGRTFVEFYVKTLITLFLGTIKALSIYVLIK